MNTLDYNALQSEIIAALRGKTSQAHLSKKLGFNSNRVHRWETGQTLIAWPEFVKVCAKLKVPLDKACRDILFFQGDIGDSKLLVRHLFGDEKQTMLAKRYGVSRSMISRWQSGSVEPSLSQVLEFIQHSFFSLPEFIGKIASIGKIRSIQDELKRERDEKQLHYENPWVAALLLYMRTIDYDRLPEHREGFLAKRMGISLEKEREIVQRLIEVGAIEKEKGREIYQPRLRSINTLGEEEGNRRIREYWTDRCLKTIKKKLPDRAQNSWGYMVLNTSPQTFERIRERYHAFFQDVHAISQENTGGSRDVYLLNVQILDVETLEK